MFTYRALGLMSGTSLDGLDIALCNFYSENHSRWTYNIEKAETYKYTSEWKNRLSKAHIFDAYNFVKTHIEYGHLLGETINCFINKHQIKDIDFIASHGHTVFHQPENKITSQIGDGSAISALTGLKVICDFRSKDVALGGQGAPLVPIGDMLLFAEYDYCLNLGGFANISYNNNNIRIAFDVCSVNMALNYLASQLGEEMDTDGNFAAQGIILPELLSALNSISFFSQAPPKSLSREWFNDNVLPLLFNDDYTVYDKLRTVTEHISIQISAIINHFDKHNILITGGGANNKFLISLLKNKLNNFTIHSDSLTIDYKEALIFAFLGVLRLINKPNCLSSVTGSKSDNIGGAIY